MSPESQFIPAIPAIDDLSLKSDDLRDPDLIGLRHFPRQPLEQPRSSLFSVTADGREVDALDADLADFVLLEWRCEVEIRIRTEDFAGAPMIKPSSLGLRGRVEGGEFVFRLSHAANVCVEFPDRKPLFIYAYMAAGGNPVPNDRSVRYYKAGRVYHEGTVNLKSGETLYLEAGAVLRANLFCADAEDVKICGHGILDGSLYNFRLGKTVKSIVLQNCRRVTVEDITMIHPSSWMLVLARCEGVEVRRLKQIGSCMSSDGIDICGSKNVLIEDCCLRNEDDNIAIKSVQFPESDWRGDVENVHVRRCSFLNGKPGNVMEIGYELLADSVRNIRFEDIDVIAAHGEGAVFSIHNGDRAVVENIRWENIRIEHYWDKLIDLRVVKSRYNRDVAHGVIRDVHLKDIRVTHSPFNPGCSVSLISGNSADSPVRNVVLENFFLNDVHVRSADELELHTRNAEGVCFR